MVVYHSSSSFPPRATSRVWPFKAGIISSHPAPTQATPTPPPPLPLTNPTQYLFYFFGTDPKDPIVLHFHFGMSGAFRTTALPGPEPTATTRLQLLDQEAGTVSHLSAMTVLHGSRGEELRWGAVGTYPAAGCRRPCLRGLALPERCRLAGESRGWRAAPWAPLQPGGATLPPSTFHPFPFRTDLYDAKRSKLGPDPLREDADEELVWSTVSTSKKSIGWVDHGLRGGAW